MNGMRETTRLTDFEAGIDALDLGTADINRIKETGNSVMLWIGEDNDQIIISGIDSFDQLIFA